MTGSPSIPLSPYEPFDPALSTYTASRWGFAMPTRYDAWKQEVMSWKTGCSFHAGLNPTFTYRVTGPDATRMLNRLCVNNVERLRVGASTHAIMCAPSGHISAHGMLLRLAEEEYLTYWLMPIVSAHAESGAYDVTGEDLTGRVFLFQLAGPRSLEVLEAALGDDLHDVAFLRHREAEVAGARIRLQGGPLNVLRVGMAGTLGYEVHGDIADAAAVYAAILQAGRPFGLQRLSYQTYIAANHIENGFPQSMLHFPLAMDEDPVAMDHLRAAGRLGDDPSVLFPPLTGSYERSRAARALDPVAIGWGHMVKLDHDFVGREALEPLLARPERRMVSLIWNTTDVLDTFASQFEPGDEYQLMTFPGDETLPQGDFPMSNDEVRNGDELVGMSMGRMYSYAYRKMISAAPVRVEHSEPGTELTVRWGEPGTRQKDVRATVAPYPILDLERNEAIDVSAIPRGVARAE